MRKINIKRFYIWIILSIMTMVFIFTSVNVDALKAFAASSSSSIFSGIAGSPNGGTLYKAVREGIYGYSF